jgi:hypothetical protein
MPVPAGCAARPAAQETAAFPECRLQDARLKPFLEVIRGAGTVFTYNGEEYMTGSEFAMSVNTTLCSTTVAAPSPIGTSHSFEANSTREASMKNPLGVM